jgi:SpoVK/Ycf46/Vps4 family AAA+-type ATPase
MSEKAVCGMQSSARTDGGATSRVVGSLLSWLAEPHPGVFVIATANDVRELAREQVRQGRFTPVFVDLPTSEDRADASPFRHHLGDAAVLVGDRTAARARYSQALEAQTPPSAAWAVYGHLPPLTVDEI